MIVKLIEVSVKPGHWDDYLAAQEIWNRETRGATGFMGGFCGRCEDEHDKVRLLFFWRSRDDLDRWMQTEHDRIAALAKADEHFDRLKVRILDPVLAPDMRVVKPQSPS